MAADSTPIEPARPKQAVVRPPHRPATLRVPQPEGELHFSRQAKVWTVVILVALLIIFVLRIFPILFPFLWAVVIAYLFNGLVTRVTNRTGAPRWVWVAVLFLLIIALLAALISFIVPSITQEFRQLGHDIPNAREQINTYLGEHETVTFGPITIASDTARSAIDAALNEIPDRARSLAPELVGRTFETVLQLIIFFVASFYLTMWGGKPIFRFIDRLPITYRAEMRGLVLRIDRVLTAYIRAQFLLIIIMSVATSLALTILNVRYAIIVGIATGFLELIPFVGPYTAVAIAMAVAYFQGNTPNFGLDHTTLAIVVLVIYLILRQLEDYVVVPLLVGRVVHLNPLLVIIAVLAGETILGPIGLLLAVPITAMLRIIIGYLFYKVVDSDRHLIEVKSEEDIAAVFQILNTHANERVLLNIEDGGHAIFAESNLRQLQTLSRDHNIDVAVCCTNEEESEEAREYGIPVVDRPMVST